MSDNLGKLPYDPADRFDVIGDARVSVQHFRDQYGKVWREYWTMLPVSVDDIAELYDAATLLEEQKAKLFEAGLSHIDPTPNLFNLICSDVKHIGKLSAKSYKQAVYLAHNGEAA